MKALSEFAFCVFLRERKPLDVEVECVKYCFVSDFQLEVQWVSVEDMMYFVLVNRWQYCITRSLQLYYTVGYE